MPFTRHPLEYRVNGLYLKVGLALLTWVPRLPLAYSLENRVALEVRLREQLGLDAAVSAHLLQGCRFMWSPEGKLETIHLVPHPAVRRVPGLAVIRRQFFPQARVPGRPAGYRPDELPEEGESFPLYVESYLLDEDPDAEPPPRTRGRPRKFPAAFTDWRPLVLRLAGEPHELVLNTGPTGAGRSAPTGVQLFPMVCHGAACPLAGDCPFGEPAFAYRGYGCPRQALWLFRQLLRLLPALDPDVPLGAAAEILRLQLEISRIDLRLQQEGEQVPAVAAVVERTGQRLYRATAHPLLDRQLRLQEQLRRLLQQHRR